MPSVTKYEANKCWDLLSQIDIFIPQRGYVELVQRILRARGFKRADTDIINARNKRRADWEIMLALEKIAIIPDEVKITYQ